MTVLRPFELLERRLVVRAPGDARSALVLAAAGALFFCVFVGSPRGLHPWYLAPDGGLVDQERA